MTAAVTWTRSRPLGACFAALLAGAVLARYGLGAAGLIAAGTTAVLVVLSLIDAESHRLPNRIVLPSAAFVLAARLVTEPGHWQAWLGASLGAFACFLVLALIVPAGIGMGDVKLMLLLGAALGAAVLPALVARSARRRHWGRGRAHPRRPRRAPQGDSLRAVSRFRSNRADAPPRPVTTDGATRYRPGVGSP